MDLGIKELGITFLVGAFTILGIELILYHYFHIHLTGFFQGRLGLAGADAVDAEKKSNEDKDKAETKELTMRTAVFIGLAFAIGILAEDLSSKYRDSLFIPFRSVSERILPDSLVGALDLPVIFDSRFKTLIYLNDEQKLVPNALAKDLAYTQAFSHVDPARGKKIEEWIADDQNRCTPGRDATATCPSLSELTHSIHKLYYYAKNNAYGHENYYDEMKRIQIRLDFSRSISMIALIYFCIAVFMLVPLQLAPTSWLMRKLPGINAWLLKVKQSLRTKRPEREVDDPRPHQFSMLFRVPMVLLILFMVYFVGGWAYAREAEEFNKRAFGYFSSMQIKQKTPPTSEPNNDVSRN
jgi:hypothetical protein